MPKTPEEKIAALKAELTETQDAAAGLIMNTLRAIGLPPNQHLRMAGEFQSIADGRMRSRVTAIIARKVAEKMRAEKVGN